jgi:hypothetical protein
MRVIGNIDRCDDQRLPWWISIVGVGSKKLQLEVTLRNVVIGRCVADNFREDLLDAGKCAFNFVVPAFVARSELAVRLENSVVAMEVCVLVSQYADIQTIERGKSPIAEA